MRILIITSLGLFALSPGVAVCEVFRSPADIDSATVSGRCPPQQNKNVEKKQIFDGII